MPTAYDAAPSDFFFLLLREHDRSGSRLPDNWLEARQGPQRISQASIVLCAAVPRCTAPAVCGLACDHCDHLRQLSTQGTTGQPVEGPSRASLRRTLAPVQQIAL